MSKEKYKDQVERNKQRLRDILEQHPQPTIDEMARLLGLTKVRTYDYIRMIGRQDLIGERGKHKRTKEMLQKSSTTGAWNRVLDANKVKRIRKLYRDHNVKQKDIAEMYGITVSNVSHIVNRRSWRHV